MTEDLKAGIFDSVNSNYLFPTFLSGIASCGSTQGGSGGDYLDRLLLLRNYCRVRHKSRSELWFSGIL